MNWRSLASSATLQRASDANCLWPLDGDGAGSEIFPAFSPRPIDTELTFTPTAALDSFESGTGYAESFPFKI
jgi:hypothetical protein